ncbi:3-deoxy-D-manno-octulosonic acid transferase [Labrenzia sp. PHM005]|uniref:3-deoxy-D-manno-octulosonic acid transferase n=1 Tax=Labrenzia sp. PHM005 TaxID=2590016 RepID=UPI001140644B|nr:3-deoxy-D-manno-octulosonic acid transferase [Labrenzia sp. PHM005]QDG79147.1 3-deoxy-D-manno-octulosonic acid transferase [Labrenzia sp. PHM005]
MAERRPVLLSIYRAFGWALTPLLHLLFSRRSKGGKEIAHRKGERFGVSQKPRPQGLLVWIHAASVGETMSILPLIQKLAGDGHSVLLTSVTVTAAELADKRLPDGCFHQFTPYDTPTCVSGFLDHWRPDLAMVVESEIWPCLFDEIHQRGIPFALLNARMSEGSCRNWMRAPRISKYIFGCLDLVLAQSSADQDRFNKLGCRQVETPGNLKFDAAEPAADGAALKTLKTQIADRPIWLAALTHPGEDEIALAAHARLRQTFPDLLLVLVPRHPARADEVAELIGARGHTLARRSKAEVLTLHTDVYLGDTLGEMGLFYRLAPVTFLGGSFNDAGGHNPVEAVLLGSALITGPKVANARAVYKDLWDEKAGVQVMQPEKLTEAVIDLLQNSEVRAEQADRAMQLIIKGRGALQRSADLLKPLLAGQKLSSAPENNNGQGA